MYINECFLPVPLTTNNEGHFFKTQKESTKSQTFINQKQSRYLTPQRKQKLKISKGKMRKRETETFPFPNNIRYGNDGDENLN